jgi:hypothetical protein
MQAVAPWQLRVLVQVVSLNNSRTISSLTTNLNTISTLIGAIPNATAFNASLNAIVNSLASISLAGISSTLNHFDYIVRSRWLCTYCDCRMIAILQAHHLPNFTTVTVELNKIDNIRGMLDCVEALIVDVHAFNATLVALPDAFNQVRCVCVEWLTVVIFKHDVG